MRLVLAEYLGSGFAGGSFCCCKVWGSLLEINPRRRPSILQILGIRRKDLVCWVSSGFHVWESRGSTLACPQCPAFSTIYTVSTNLSSQAAEEDRLRAKSGQGDRSGWLHCGLGQGVPGRFQGQLGCRAPQLRAGDTSPDFLPHPSVLQLWEFPLRLMVRQLIRGRGLPHLVLSGFVNRILASL